MGKILAYAVAALAVVLLVLHCSSRGTSPEVKKQIEVQYHQLSLRLVVLEPNQDNYQSVAAQLDSIRWEPIEDGGDYETHKKEMFLDEKRKKAEEIKEYYREGDESMTPHIIEHPEDIKE